MVWIALQATPTVAPVANLAALQAAALQQAQASDNPILTAAKRAAGQIAAKVRSPFGLLYLIMHSC